MNGGLEAWLLVESLSYPGWQEDYQAARDAATDSTTSGEFRNTIHRLHEKQRVHDGDRSHPRLVRLDELAQTLTYPGWEDDVQNAEQAHYNNYYDITSDDLYFRSKLEGLQNRQQLYFGYSAQLSTPSSTGRSHDEIVAMLGTCIICGERNKTHLFDPCGHLCACQSCGDQVMRSSSPSCPVCRVVSAKIMRVFFT